MTTVLAAAIILKANAATTGVDQWIAPSVVGLDPTSSAWLSKLPKYQIDAAPQMNTLVSNAPVALPPQGSAPGGIAPSPNGPDATEQPTVNMPFQSSWHVIGKFVTPLSNDLYTGADTAMMGIVWGRVDIRRCSDNVYLMNGLTMGYGAYAGTFDINIGTNPYGAGFKAYIYPYSSAGSVRTGAGAWSSYGTVTPCFYPGETATFYNIGTWNIYSGAGYLYRGAWMIYETIVNDARNWGTWNFFANRLGGYYIVMPHVIVRFPFETWAHYHLGGEIHLPTMNDARSPDVIQHEYGHFAMYTTYGGYFTTYCPSPHYITGVSHVNCAWSEGWASYVPYMAHGDKTYTYANNFDVNEETSTWGTSGWANGAAVEGRVTGALIDLADGQNEGVDLASGRLIPDWWVFRYKGLNVNFHDFMADYKSVYAYNTIIVLTLYQNTIYYTDL